MQLPNFNAPSKTSLNISQSEILAYNGFVKAAGLFFSKNNVLPGKRINYEMSKKRNIYF